MPLRQLIAALVLAMAVFLLVIELVRRRQLREEYSLLWIVTTLIMIVLVLRYDWLVALTNFIGAVAPTTTLFLLGLLFLIVINIHFSIRVSKLNTQVKNLGQENALLRNKLERFEGEKIPTEDREED